MKAIQTKYLGATDTKPSRIKASAEGVPSKIYSRHSFPENLKDCHHEAAQRFARENNWPVNLASGGLPDPDVWVHCFIR